MTFNINRNVSWTSRFYYFTDYHRITGEFENTFNLQISRFFSTRINLHLRYDDGVAKNEDFDSYPRTFDSDCEKLDAARYSESQLLDLVGMTQSTVNGTAFYTTTPPPSVSSRGPSGS